MELNALPLDTTLLILQWVVGDDYRGKFLRYATPQSVARVKNVASRL